MKRFVLNWVPLCCLVLLSTSMARANELTIERVASLPSLTGTAPSGLAWSSDSQWLAFLWNEEGWPFRDIYVVRSDGSGRRRLTHLAETHPLPEPPQGNATADLAARAAARAHGGVSEIVWLPDSDGVLFSYRGEVYRMGLDDEAPQSLTLGPASRMAVSPDGKMLAFLREGDIWTWSLKGKKPPEQLTEIGIAGIGSVPLGTYYKADREVGTGVWGASWPPFAWSPDSKTIVFHQSDRRHLRQVPFPYYLGEETQENQLRRGYPGDENERRELGLLDVRKRSVTMIDLPEPGARSISDFAWSEHGEILVDHVSDDGTRRWVYVVDGESGETREIWRDERDTRIYPAYVARWHADGKRILIVADLSDRDHIYLLDTTAERAEPQPLTAGDWDVAGERGAAGLAVSPRGEVFFTGTANSPYERHIYRVARGDTAWKAVTTRPGVHLPSLSPDGKALASIWSDDVTPPDLLLMEAKPGGREHRITHSTGAEFGKYNWVRPRYAKFTNAVDGFEVHARITEPTRLEPGKQYPVIFSGIYSNTVRNRWSGFSGTLNQFLVQQGYITVQVDVRGSVGYGRDFREAFLMDYGGKDLDDLQAVKDGLAGMPYVDAERMGIWGSSYGGLLSVYALLKRPGMFVAGVAGAPAVDPFAFGPDDIAITRTPEQYPEAFVRGSALWHGEDLEDHLLIIHGLMDDVVPFRTTMALAERLMLLGKDFDLATAPSATHGWSGPEHYRQYFYRKLVQYFDQHLKVAVP